MNCEETEFYTDLLQEGGYGVHADPILPGLHFDYSGRKFWLMGTNTFFFIHHMLTVEGAKPDDYPRILDAVNHSNMLNGSLKAVAFKNVVDLTGSDNKEGELDAMLARITLLSSMGSLMNRMIEAADELMTNLNNPDYADTLRD